MTLPSVSKCLTFYRFADDTNIYFEASDLFTLQKVVNRELRHVKKWLDANKLALNVDKTNFVIFRSHGKKLTERIAFEFGCKKISQADHVRFLGVLLDETLGWKPHLVELSRKLAKSFGILYKLGYYVPLDTLRAVYYALFHPFLTYGIVVWGSTFENLLNPVRVAHKKVLKAMTFSDPTAHSSLLFYDLKILNLSLMICTSYQSQYLHMNAKTLPHFISLTFSLKLLMYTPTTPEVLLVEISLFCKKTLCSMAYDQSVLMEQRSGIAFILK